MTASKPIDKGARLPDTALNTMRDGEISETNLAAWSAGRRVALIVVPGAFTPTCSARHLPGYVANAAAFAEKGIAAIGCMAVNDIFVVNAWGDAVGATGKVDMFADAAGETARAMGIATVNVPTLGNTRAARLALIADDGVVEQIFMEKPAAFEVSAAEYVLARI